MSKEPIFNSTIAAELLDKKLVRRQTHPELPLTIWNYTQQAQFEKAWDEYPILLQLRGLVTDNEFNIVARPFKKFFNIEENRHIPTNGYDVYAKMDGSLGIIFNYAGKWHCATRGSFTSDQAIKGSELMQPYLMDFDDTCTYLCEIIYKNNQVVIRYPFEDIILLGVIHKTGLELEPHSCMQHSLIRKCPKLRSNKTYYNSSTPLESLKNHIPDDEEGYVVKFKNGDRCKIKGANYLRLHRILTNITSYSIWNTVNDPESFSRILENIPDEMFDPISIFYTALIEAFEARRYYFHTLAEDLRMKYGNDMKIMASVVKTTYKNESAMVFAALNGMESRLNELIHREIKPKYFKF